MTSMRAVEGSGGRSPAGPIAIVAMLALLAVAVPAGLPALELAGLTLVVSMAVLVGKDLVRWRSLVAFLIVVILYIPIKKYSLPGNLPFDLEPYRLLAALIAVAWVVSLLIDPRVRVRRGGLELPFALLVAAMLGGVITNGDRIAKLDVDNEVIKALTFFLSYLLVFYVIVSVVRTFADVDRLVRILVGGAIGVAAFAFYEARTGYNIFDHLSSFVPGLELDTPPEQMKLGSRLRVAGSGQGAIPFGAAMMLLVPMAIYVATRSNRWYWWVGTLLIALGGLGTNSRTTIVMVIASLVVLLWLRPRFLLRLWPALIPLLVVVNLALPGTIGTLHQSFFPEGGLIAQQSQHAGWRGSGRIADLGPSLDEWSEKPLLGQGYGTRLTGRGPRANALILDDQWLKTLLEIGVVGAVAWLWIFVRSVGRLGRLSRNTLASSDEGWLAVAIAASLTSFAVGMIFYDAFSFIQVTFLMFILLALGSVLVQLNRGEARETSPRLSLLQRSRASYPG